jgi:hypothetical protein
MTQWATERIALFNSLLGQFGTTLQFNGASFNCIKGYQTIEKEMKQTLYQEKIPTTFTMLKADFVASGIKNLSKITSGGFTFEVKPIITDDIDPLTDLGSVLKQ